MGKCNLTRRHGRHTRREKMSTNEKAEPRQPIYHDDRAENCQCEECKLYASMDDDEQDQHDYPDED